MTTIKYKGYNIMARPYQLSATKRWTVDLEIRRHGRSQPFSLDERYRTEREADARCSGLGRDIIDGGIPGWSVDHLRPRRNNHRRQLLAAGIVILALGAMVLLREPSFTPWSDLMWAVNAAADMRHSVPIWAGGAALVGGIALIAAGTRKSS